MAMSDKFYKSEIPFELSDYVLKKYFEDTGKRQGWFPANNRGAVIAVSGGGDSVALLWLFHKFYDGKIFVVHVNHGIRGHEADEDENFVMKLAQEFGVEAAAEKINVPEQKLKGESLEAAARRLRREAICEIIHQKFPTSYFLTPTCFLGHNRDDLAETVLFNILRGSGIRGAVGMTECTEYNGIKFFRPLLGLRRDFLREILKVRKIPWRDDSTNDETEYTRNFIRLKILPLIDSKINSSAIEHLANFGEDMRALRQAEDERSRELLERCRDSDFQNLVLSRKILRTFTNEERALVIREAGRNLNLKTLSRERCEKLANLIAKSSNFIFQWSRKMTIKSENGKIIFEGSENENDA